MKKTACRFGFILLLALTALPVPAAVTRMITINTSSLMGSAAGPFQICFQLNDGSGVGNGNNSAVIENFQFGGGQPFGSPQFLGGAAGSLSSRVEIVDNSWINVFVQPFVAGTQLSFTMTLSSTVEVGSTPDQFSVSILDHSGTEIPTTGGRDFDVLVAVEIESGDSAPQIFNADMARLPAAGGGPIAVETAVVTPVSSCAIALLPSGQSFGAAGGGGTIVVTAPAGCVWSILGAPGWVTNNMSGSGDGTLTYQVTANAGTDRTAQITVAGISFTIEQEAVSLPGLNFIGSMAHLAGEENWTTMFTLVNKGAATAQARLSLFGDALDPTGNGPLLLPLAFPQQGSSLPLLAASFDRTLGGNASLIVNTAGAQAPPVLVGSAQLAATGSVDGFAIFHQIVTTQEAVVPMETRNASSYLLAFDNTNGLVLGVAVQNVSSQNAIIPVVIRDDNGTVISTPGATISLGANGHTAFVLSTQFPVTSDKRGTIEFDTPAGGQISVLGLRFTPPNNALTTIPALANVGTGGGSIAHLASGGDGWQTTFVLVNAGTNSAQATLSFFADQTGAPLSLPLSFPQSGSGAVTQNSFVTQTLAAGATLVIQSTGAPQLLTGSGQLTTAGHVSGFVIFRHNGQEAVVPLESRNATGYLVAFDNTNGTATGVALNAVSAQQVNVPVVVRNDAGTQIATDTISLAANGHYAFTLVNDRYPGTANIRGTIEFTTPAGAQIGALGIRIPNVAAHTYTTLPALAK